MSEDVKNLINNLIRRRNWYAERVQKYQERAHVYTVAAQNLQNRIAELLEQEEEKEDGK